MSQPLDVKMVLGLLLGFCLCAYPGLRAVLCTLFRSNFTIYFSGTVESIVVPLALDMTGHRGISLDKSNVFGVGMWTGSMVSG
jgi:hypothetical protein